MQRWWLLAILKLSKRKKWITQYFETIPSATLPAIPDISEPKQQAEKRNIKEDKLANKPAIAIAYKMPQRNTPGILRNGADRSNPAAGSGQQTLW
jgi:hypothetical protein